MPILQKEPSIYPETVLLGVEDMPESAIDEVDDSAQRVWWCVYTKARQEKALARQLYGQNVPFYLPLALQRSLISGRKRESYLPIFRGYLFLFGTDEERIISLATNRISAIIPVHDQEQLRADLLKLHRLIETEAPITVEKLLEPGRPVRIKSGAMKGMEGEVIQRRGKDRLLVAVKCLNQGVSVDIDDFMVEPF